MTRPLTRATLPLLALLPLLLACGDAPTTTPTDGGDGSLSISVKGGGGDGSGIPVISFGTGSPGGVYFPFGEALTRLSRGRALLVASEASGGSVDNCRRVADGSLDAGLSLGGIAYAAVNGFGPFREPQPLVSLAVLYHAAEHIVVRADSDIRAIADLRGKRVFLGMAGSGNRQMAQAILDAAGVATAELKVADMSQAEAASALADKVIDVVFWNFGHPAKAMSDLAERTPLRLVALTPELIATVRKKHPQYLGMRIPEDTYKGVPSTMALADANVIVAHRDLPADRARAFLQLIFDKLDDLHAVHPVLRQISAESAGTAPIPTHPAAKALLDSLPR